MRFARSQPSNAHGRCRLITAALLSLVITACGGGSGSTTSASGIGGGSGGGYTVGGTLAGLNSGTQITLDDNGADPLTVIANGSFTFSSQIASGSGYNVTIASQPNGQYCRVSNGTGTVSAGAVSSVQVACSSSERVLYTFTGGNDGMLPVGGLVMDGAGNLFGTTVAGGDINTSNANCSNGCGTVFELSPNGSGSYTESILYRFTGGSDGNSPAGGLVMDAAGNLYGTTQWGTGSSFYGTVFRLAPGGGGSYTESILYSFTGGRDGQEPHAGLIMDGAGNLYGTTYYGGTTSTNCGTGCGTVFKLAPSSGGYTESILYRFTDYPDGAYPQSGLTMDSSGNLYGTTSLGGDTSHNNAGAGTVFELSPGAGSYTETLLYRFADDGDGAWPFAGLTLDGAGNLYGTTTVPPGVVFELSPTSGGGYSESTLYIFTGGEDGSTPFAGLILDSAGDLFGTTNSGGSSNDGTAFVLTPSDGTFAEATLHTFTGGNDGASSYTGLIMDKSGNLYGTTKYGGSASDGVVFEVSIP